MYPMSIDFCEQTDIITVLVMSFLCYFRWLTPHSFKWIKIVLKV